MADLVRNEHPQIIAIVMAHLKTDALKLLPDRTRVDVLLHRHRTHSAERPQ